MKNLLYKEYKISIHRFFYIFPLLIAWLMMIPQWFYLIVFMYFFWITVPNIYSGYNVKNDYLFTQSLPVSKKNIVQSKVLSLISIELLHFISALLVAILHNYHYGIFNFGLDLNYAFFGFVLIMFSLFNIVFLPAYFKTAFHYGKPLIYGTIATLIYGAIIEFSNMYYPSVNNVLEGDLKWQIVILILGIIIFLVSSIVTIKISLKNYRNIA